MAGRRWPPRIPLLLVVGGTAFTHPGEPISALSLASRESGSPLATADAADAAERARTAVRKAIKRSVDAVVDASPRIADVLRSTVTTGTTCVYTPDPDDPVAWSPPPIDGED